MVSPIVSDIDGLCGTLSNGRDATSWSKRLGTIIKKVQTATATLEDLEAIKSKVQANP